MLSFIRVTIAQCLFIANEYRLRQSLYQEVEYCCAQPDCDTCYNIDFVTLVYEVETSDFFRKSVVLEGLLLEQTHEGMFS